ncbi:MAG TPA: hypothetical protein VD999_03515 [Vitreimonas sp.]|nr:hypothetical protein [Vitreimonas sp.]
MSNTAPQYCQRFTQAYGELKSGFNEAEFKAQLEELLTNPTLELYERLRKQYQETLGRKFALQAEYEEQAWELMRKYFTEDNPQDEVFFDNLVLDPTTNTFILQGDFHNENGHKYTFFPNLIREVTGNITLFDAMTELGGVKRIGGELDLELKAESGEMVFNAPHLEYAYAIKSGANKGCVFNFPSLTEIEDELEISDSAQILMPQLRKCPDMFITTRSAFELPELKTLQSGIISASDVNLPACEEVVSLKLFGGNTARARLPRLKKAPTLTLHNFLGADIPELVTVGNLEANRSKVNFAALTHITNGLVLIIETDEIEHLDDYFPALKRISVNRPFDYGVKVGDANQIPLLKQKFEKMGVMIEAEIKGPTPPAQKPLKRNNMNWG